MSASPLGPERGDSEPAQKHSQRHHAGQPPAVLHGTAGPEVSVGVMGVGITAGARARRLEARPKAEPATPCRAAVGSAGAAGPVVGIGGTSVGTTAGAVGAELREPEVGRVGASKPAAAAAGDTMNRSHIASRSAPSNVFSTAVAWTLHGHCAATVRSLHCS